MSSGNTTVCLSFDFDAVSLWIGGFALTSPTYISRGEFAANVATPRILDLLEREGIASSWFIPGMDAETYPDVCKRIRDSGHDIGHHNYAHENPLTLTEQQERDIMERGLDSLDRVLGVRPKGYRSPAFDLSPHTIDILVDHGFEYDSSMMGDDFTPYLCRTGDVISATEPPVWGPTTQIVEIPVAWALDDFPFTEFVPPVMMANTDVAAMGERWIADLDFAIDRVDGGVFTLTMHPQAIGRSSRLTLLENVIRHGKERGVTFATLNDVASGFNAAR